MADPLPRGRVCDSRAGATARLMALAGLAMLVVCGVGLLPTRALRTPLVMRFGLAPGVGLATLAVLGTWGALVRLPVALVAVITAVAAIGGGWMTWTVVGRSRRCAAPDWRRYVYPGLVASSVVVVLLVLAGAFVGLDVPPSTHDGAEHVERIQAYRQGGGLADWYPPGYHVAAATLLAFVPWVDSAHGSLEVAFAVSALAPLGIAGVSFALWRHLPAAAFAACLLALTFLYPFEFQVWGGWPLGAGLLMLLALWAVGVEYLRQPRCGWAVLGGVLLAGIVLTHGTELYSAAVLLAVAVLATSRRVVWPRLVRDVPLALLAGVVLAAPYLPALLGWAGQGGAQGVALASGDTGARSVAGAGGLDVIQVVFGSVGAGSWVDLLPRWGLFCLGVWGAWRSRQGRHVAVQWLLVLVLNVGLQWADVPLASRVFALTFPWAANGRLQQVLVLLFALLAGQGLAQVVAALCGVRTRWPSRFGIEHPVAWRRLVVAGAALTFFLVEGSVLTAYRSLQSTARMVTAYAADDGAAAAWLRERHLTGAVVANDFSADAGIWLPFTAGTPILAARSAVPDVGSPEWIVLHNVDRLTSTPDTIQAVCASGVRYVYSGAKTSAYEARTFPSREVLRQADGLREVFASGDASVFEVEVPCTAVGVAG